MAVMVVPGPCRAGIGHGEPGQSKREPDQVFGKRRQVVSGEIEPGPVIEIAGEEQVGVITLGNVSVLVLERGGEPSRGKNSQAGAGDGRRHPQPRP